MSGKSTWTIGELARLSGVTSRTLRHYDAIDLLAPLGSQPGGRRVYGRRELLRLQQILVLRELDVSLPTVAELLADDDADGASGLSARMLGTLREHRDRLLTERDRFTRLARTVDATITALERGEDMAADKLYEGFDHSQYEAEARERWGDEAVEEANRRVAAMTEVDGQRVQQTYSRVHAALAELRDAGVPVTDERVQAQIGEHYGIVALFWTPDAAAYAGLGRMYVDDERFRANIGRGDDALVEYQRDAMTVYAEQNLT